MGKTTSKPLPASLSRLADQQLSAEQILALQRLPEEFAWRAALAQLTPADRAPKATYLDPYVVGLLDQIALWQNPETSQRLRAYLPALSTLGQQQSPDGAELRRLLVQGQIANIIIPLAQQQAKIDLSFLGCHQQSSLLDQQLQRDVGRAVAEVYGTVQEVYGPESSELPSKSVVDSIISVGLASDDQYFQLRLADVQRQRADDRADVPGSSYQQLLLRRLINNLQDDIGLGLIALAQHNGQPLSALHRQAQDGKFAILDTLISNYQRK